MMDRASRRNAKGVETIDQKTRAQAPKDFDAFFLENTATAATKSTRKNDRLISGYWDTVPITPENPESISASPNLLCNPRLDYT